MREYQEMIYMLKLAYDNGLGDYIDTKITLDSFPYEDLFEILDEWTGHPIICENCIDEDGEEIEESYTFQIQHPVTEKYYTLLKEKKDKFTEEEQEKAENIEQQLRKCFQTMLGSFW
jgi:hypothetical protein